MKSLLLIGLISFFISSPALTQSISGGSKSYLFYLHGAVVTELGDNAINQSVPEWGPYEYSKILDSLRKQDFVVISEIRKKGVPNEFYVNKICSQIDSLLRLKIPAKNITVLGASAGWDIGVRVSSKLKNKQVNYVIMGGCWPNTYKEFISMELYGNFLSIYEKSDPHGSCMKIFEGRKNIRHKEIMLDTGLSHGFIYKGHQAWIYPLVRWLKEKK
jgi:hypothetical protein